MAINKGGRPTKLTAETTKKICDAILVGSTYEAAAQYAGVNYSTFRMWMKRGEDGKGRKFVEFLETVETANASAQVYFATNIKSAATAGDWRAAAWMLERRFKQDYAAKQEVEHSGEIGFKGYVGWSPDDWNKPDETE